MKPLRMAILAVAISASSIPAFANSSSDPAAAYCNDLNTAVQEKMNASMHKRMPSSMPGEFMNDVYGVDKMIDQEIAFAEEKIPSPYRGLFKMLIDWGKSKISEGKKSLLSEINSTLKGITDGVGVNLQVSSETFSSGKISVTAPGYNQSFTGSAASAVSPSTPVSGAPVYSNSAQQGEAVKETSGGWANDFFKKLF